jgi:cell division septum initiation protein DivIVA
MSIYRIIDKLETYVREGTWLPFGLRILSEKRLYEFVDKMRSTLPEEVGRAKVIATNKDRMIRQAQEKAQQIVIEAAETHSHLIDQQEILKRARTMAEALLRESEEQAARVRSGADVYAAQVLTDLEGRLTVALGSVKKGQEALEPRASEQRNVRSDADAAVDDRILFDAQLEQTHLLEPVEIAT